MSKQSTAAPPSDDPFQALAVDFGDLVSRYAGTGKCHRDLLGELRDTMAKGGRDLLKAIADDGIQPPKAGAAWLEHAVAGDTSARFSAFCGSDGGGGGTFAPPEPFRELARTLCAHQATLGEPSTSGGLGHDVDRFIHRHVFLEAVTTWLAERHPTRMDPPPMPSWEATTKAGEIMMFVSDWPHPDRVTGQIDFAIPLAKASRQACVMLAASADSTDAAAVTLSDRTSPPSSDDEPIASSSRRDGTTQHSGPVMVDSPGSSQGKPLPSHAKALQLHDWAVQQEPSLRTDRAVHDWLSSKAGIPGDLPASFDTFRRYLSGARNSLDENKYSPRAGRATGKSVVRQGDI